MNKISLLTLSVVLALAGCTEEDNKDDGIKGKALGWGPGYVEAFFQSDRWHLDNKPTQNGCEGYTGDCSMPVGIDEVFTARFDEISAKANGEVTSFAQFQQMYATAIPRWLESR